MKKEIKVRNTLIAVTFVGLIISALQFTNIIYGWNYDTEKLNNLVVSNWFNILFWIDNLLVFGLGILYAVLGYKSKEDVVIKIAFSILAICTTMISSIFAINLVGEMFSIFY